ncbi:MAG: hypothetical protein K5644_09315 [Lachnospiraceae bacterium]|nr:hypothetical protein [Lachnospiraceae bacterium]
MVVAVTYDNDKIDEHFGHAKLFKLYEIQDGNVVDSAVVSNYGEGGHEAACLLMEDYNVAVVICDNIGESAVQGLQDLSISVIPNIEGLCDDAVEAFLTGKLMMQAQGMGCASCGTDAGGACCGSDSGCGGCAGGCC